MNKQLLFALLLTGCTPDRPPEVHLLPTGYEGPLIVFYGQTGYPPLPRSGDSLIFDFRPGYILRTSSPLVTGSGYVESFQYYYANAAGHLSRIRQIDNYAVLQQLPPDEPCLISASGIVGEDYTSELVTSARNAKRMGSWKTRLTDSLMRGDTVSTSLVTTMLSLHPPHQGRAVSTPSPAKLNND
jgi:hypothetical protein